MTTDDPVHPAVPGKDRPAVIGEGFAWTARWGLRLIIVAAALWVLGTVIGWFWVVLMPVVIALLITTVLWPVTDWLRRHRCPPALAASLVLLISLLVVGALIAFVIPSIVSQVPDIADQASGGLGTLQQWLAGPPFNLGDGQISGAVEQLTGWLQSSAGSIASGVLTGVGVATSILVTVATAVILVFFFLKDGPKFLPWQERVTGRRVGSHLTEVLGRSWRVLGSFIRTQAAVSLIDGVFIGVGLLIIGVPLAFPLAVITFVGGFIPIVGAFVAGGVAVLVALVTNGWVDALLTLGLIVLVQQIEGNVLQPILQSKSLNLHPAVVLLAVTGGGSLFGITGAFLAVPVVAVVVEIWRYLDEQIAAKAGERRPDPDPDHDQDPKNATPATAS